jgi:hypothetical protein
VKGGGLLARRLDALLAGEAASIPRSQHEYGVEKAPRYVEETYPHC